MKKKFSLSYIILLSLFVVAGVMSWRLYFKEYRQADTADISSFPMQIGKWTAEDIPLTEREYDILETRNVFIRRYTHGQTTESITLFIVYSQSNRKVSHPPEICYTGAGNILIEKDLDLIQYSNQDKPLQVYRVVSENGPRQEIFYYWFKVGDTFTPSYWKQQVLIAWKSFVGEVASSALIRISTGVNNNDHKAADQLIKEFGREIVPHLGQHLP
ncbi:MAG: EpsI family protein [Candidatus Omnitrophica bacterium]|nr:EpsI family protein [Candidatus Omnitrophota bacterium]